ncbi:MAG: delta-60 repeat domain-containing protein [Candidatus Brocadiales bacterium]
MPQSIQQAFDGGYIVAGTTRSFGTGEDDLWVLKLSAEGLIEWQKTYERGDYNKLYSAQRTGDSGYIVAGDTHSLRGGAPDFLVLKLRPDGSVDPSCKFVKETDISERDSYAIDMDTTATPVNSDVRPQDSLAMVQDTNVSANIFCPSTAVQP